VDAFFVIDINHYITAFYRTGALHRDASAHEFNNYLYTSAAIEAIEQNKTH